MAMAMVLIMSALRCHSLACVECAEAPRLLNHKQNAGVGRSQLTSRSFVCFCPPHIIPEVVAKQDEQSQWAVRQAHEREHDEHVRGRLQPCTGLIIHIGGPHCMLLGLKCFFNPCENQLGVITQQFTVPGAPAHKREC